MTRVFNLSGGKTSAYMTIAEKPGPEDIVLFTDTGREHPATYRFLDEIERHEGFKIHRVTYTHPRSPGKTGFDALTHWKHYLPNRVKRICTVELKIMTARRYLRPLIGTRFEQFIGFRADEPQRVKNFKGTYKHTVTRFPLYEQGITKAMINAYWETRPYNLEIPPILGNCDLCFLKGKSNIIKIMAQYPELAEKWIEDERRSAAGRDKPSGTFFKDTTYAELLEIALAQKTNYSLEDAEPAYSCACTA
ncbi:phosphoadenosine phosphosulfate reductase family protein [Mucilaginibacter angelicae]|uniref:Phosphoadenosine phosphosulfate reductase family protein n=1 Tax=Mucilaginibacter angelicae TaxID=869718 RepID=A0ABV6L593_9SPHI